MATGKSREGDGGDDPKSEDLLETGLRKQMWKVCAT